MATKVKSYRINVTESARVGDAIVLGENGCMTSQHLGTAASFDVGTCPSNVPIVNSCGVLPDAVIPADAMKKSIYDPNNKQVDVFDYCNLENAPEIPVVNDPVVTFKQGGVTMGSISLNQAGATEIELMAGGVTAGSAIDINCNVVSVDYDNTSIGVNACDELEVKDYSTIVSGAAAGATAVQPNDLATVATSGKYCDLTGTPTIPTDNCQLGNGCGYITNAVSDLTNYYLKCETYKKCEVDNLIANFGGFEVVSTLPTTNIKTNVIYLLGPIGTGADKYEEWIYYNNTWTKIGETTTDLSNYAKCCDIPTDNCQLSNGCGYTTCTGTLVTSDLEPYTKSCDLCAVATSGLYCDLTGSPTLCAVATSAKYCDLTDTPSLCAVATSGKYCDLTGTPTIPATLSAGNGISITSNCINVVCDNCTIKKDNNNQLYADFTGLATTDSLCAVATSGMYCDLTDAPSLCTVATSGCYCDLTGTPTIPTDNCQLANSCGYTTCTGTLVASDLNGYAKSCDLATVATSGKYCDLVDAIDLSCKQDTLVLGTNLHYDTDGCLQVGTSNNDLQGMRYVCASYLKTSSGTLNATPTAVAVLDSNGWICKQTPSCFIDKMGFKTVATSGCYCDLTGIPTLCAVATSGQYCDLTGAPTIPTDNCQLANSCGYTTCTGTLDGGDLVTINGCCLVGSGDICIQGGVTSVNGCTGAVCVCEVPSGGSCGQVLQKTADGCGWASISLSGGDMSYSDFDFVSKSGATVTLDLSSTITPTANFTVNVPSTIKEGQAYVLRVTSGATAYTMTLGTGITNPFGVDLTLEADTTSQFIFYATSSSTLELQNNGEDIKYVTQEQYEALPSSKLTNGISYFIYETVEP